MDRDLDADHASGEITALLERWAHGDRAASETLFEAVYPELRRIARQYLLRESRGDFVQTTELANETYLRIVGERQAHWHSRAHFFALFATHLRRALVDHARRRRRLKRGAGSIPVALDALQLAVDAPSVDLLALHQALDQLATITPTAAQVVDLRFFAGLTLDETAEALKLGRSTVKRKWLFAKSWLARALDIES